MLRLVKQILIGAFLLVAMALMSIGMVGESAMAAYTTPGPHLNRVKGLTVSGAAFSGLAVNAAKTFDSIGCGGYHTVLVEIQYTYSAATAVNMTCEESPDESVWLKVPQADESSPPTVSHGQRIWTWAGTSSVNFFFEVPVRYRYLRCSIYTTGGDVNDVATVTATLAE